MNPYPVAVFFSSCRRAIAAHHKSLRFDVARVFKETGTRLAAHRSAQRAQDQVEASAFNVFQWLKPDENFLSDIFAELLDTEGAHGQGPLFLAELLQISGVPLIEGLEQARARREEGTLLIDNPLRRIDISVLFPRLQFGIGIENKPWASDEVDQVADYVRQMRQRYGERFLFLYWSGHGEMPTSLQPEEREFLERQNRLRVWSYQREVREWLQASRQACRAWKVNWFLDDLLDYLARTFVGAPRPSEEVS
jgi:hypothetical protein